MKSAFTISFMLIFTLSLSAQGRYDLSERRYAVGEKLESLAAFEGTNGKMTLLIDGQPLGEGTMSFRSSTTSVETINAVKDGKPTAYTEQITASSIRSVTNFGGSESKEENKSPLLNEVVTYTLKDGQYIPELKNATQEQRDELQPRPLVEVSQYPEKPLGVGETFELTPEMIAAMVDQDVQEKTEGKGKMTLAAVEDYQGEKCGVFEVDVKMQGPMSQDDLPEGMESGEIVIDVEGKIYRSLTSKTDLKIDLKGTTEFTYFWKEEGQNLSMRVKMDAALSGYSKLID